MPRLQHREGHGDNNLHNVCSGGYHIIMECCTTVVWPYFICFPGSSLLVPHPHPLPDHFHSPYNSVVVNVNVVCQLREDHMIPRGENGMRPAELREGIVMVPVQGGHLLREGGGREGEGRRERERKGGRESANTC